MSCRWWAVDQIQRTIMVGMHKGQALHLMHLTESVNTCRLSIYLYKVSELRRAEVQCQHGALTHSSCNWMWQIDQQYRRSVKQCLTSVQSIQSKETFYQQVQYKILPANTKVTIRTVRSNTIWHRDRPAKMTQKQLQCLQYQYLTSVCYMPEALWFTSELYNSNHATLYVQATVAAAVLRIQRTAWIVVARTFRQQN